MVIGERRNKRKDKRREKKKHPYKSGGKNRTGNISKVLKEKSNKK